MRLKYFVSVAVVLLFIISIGYSCKNSVSHPVMKIVGKDTLYLLSLKTYPVRDGWGYDIFLGNKVFIHQDQVPSISGKRVFLTEEDAKKTGNIMIQKIKKKKIPSVDSLELMQAAIRYK